MLEEKVVLSAEIKDAIAEALEIWRDEYLEGKPAILAMCVYSNMLQLLEKKTEEILERFPNV